VGADGTDGGLAELAAATAQHTTAAELHIRMQVQLVHSWPQAMEPAVAW
jgi:hypothetical protein